MRAVGLRNGKKVAEDLVRTPGKPVVALRLRADFSGRPLRADGADVVFVYAEVVDANGTVVRENGPQVRFEVSGTGALVGPDSMDAEVWSRDGPPPRRPRPRPRDRPRVRRRPEGRTGTDHRPVAAPGWNGRASPSNRGIATRRGVAAG